uniref:Uncharacterized protein n=1 Tax=Photinus pyralis TaxID=7054 RepID=A0A1Y1N0U1_PHOPY
MQKTEVEEDTAQNKVTTQIDDFQYEHPKDDSLSPLPLPITPAEDISTAAEQISNIDMSLTDIPVVIIPSQQDRTSLHSNTPDLPSPMDSVLTNEAGILYVFY